MKRLGRPTRGLLALLVAAILGTNACTPPRERRDAHLAKASQHLDAGRKQEAFVELQAALEADPEHAETNVRLAKVALELGGIEQALFYYREASRLEPERSDALLGAAALLGLRDPARGREQVERMLEREPRNARGHELLSRLALAEQDVEAALLAALRAVELDGSRAAAQLQLAAVQQARIRDGVLAGAPVPDAVFEAAIAALDAALELQGEESPLRRTDRAVVYAAWPGHAEQASAELRRALEAARRGESVAERRAVLRRAVGLAQSGRDAALMRASLEELVAVAPDDREAWRQLARLEQSQGRSADDVMRRMLEARPGEAEAHVAYALFLGRRGRPDEAIAHLEQTARKGIEPPVTLGALVNLLYGLGRPDEAAAVVERMPGNPRHPSTALALAQRAFHERRFKDAALALRETLGVAESADAHRLLAGVELRLGNANAALAAVDRSIELGRARAFPEAAHRLRARILRLMGECRGALRALTTLTRNGRELGLAERVMQAHCLDEVGRPDLGGKVLKSVLRSDPSHPVVVAELVARGSVSDPERARALLEGALEQSPANARLLEELAALELSEGRADRALARMNEAADTGRARPSLLLERAHLLARRGELERAERDALRAFRLQPSLRRVVPLLVELYRAQGTLDEALASFDKAEAAGALSPSSRLLLAHIHRVHGDEAEAQKLLERIVAGNEIPAAIPGAKKDLAFLLAEEGTDLDRALRLAEEAAQAWSDSPEAADTLGYVHLRQGRLDVAVEQFGRALELADAENAPAPLYPYHLGLALRRQGRLEEARAAFEQALAIEATFEAAARELGELDDAAQDATPSAHSG